MEFYKFEKKYPIYYDFLITEDLLSDLNKLVKYEELNYSNSQVLNIKSQKNEQNEKVRKSKKAIITNVELFDWIDYHIIPILNDKYKNINKFHLVYDELEV